MRLHLTILGQSITTVACESSGDVPLDQALPHLYQAADAMTMAGAQRAVDEAAGDVSCRAGCSACCRQLVPLAPAEARALRRHVGNLSAATRQRVAARCGAAVRQLETSGVLDLIPGAHTAGSEALELLGRAYFDEQIDCPLLEEGRCLVYADRPAACRQHLVSSPPDWCTSRPHHVRRIVPLGRPFTAAFCRAEGTSDAWVPLVLALNGDAPEESERRPMEQWVTDVWGHVTDATGGCAAVTLPHDGDASDPCR